METDGTKWSDTENLTFIMFMDYYKCIFFNKARRKKSKVYTRLSEFMKSRTPRQCRSRYQKLMKTFSNFTKAKRFYVSGLGENVY